MKQIRLTDRQIIILNHLLDISAEGWFTSDSLPKGISNVQEAERLVKQLLLKIK